MRSPGRFAPTVAIYDQASTDQVKQSNECSRRLSIICSRYGGDTDDSLQDPDFIEADDFIFGDVEKLAPVQRRQASCSWPRQWVAC